MTEYSARVHFCEYLFTYWAFDLRNGANCVGNRYEYVGVGVDVLRHITSWCP